MQSPLRSMRLRDLRVFVLTYTSSASSRTTFIYSSNPTMVPSIFMLVFSYSQISQRSLVLSSSKMTLMAWVMTLLTRGAPSIADMSFCASVANHLISIFTNVLKFAELTLRHNTTVLKLPVLISKQIDYHALVKSRVKTRRRIPDT
jgi:hypothetical protein